MYLPLDEFLRKPTKIEWYTEMFDHGWPGPNGSSCSFDHIEGVCIGNQNPHYDDKDLPANMHDWRYQIMRRLGLGEAHRRVADLGYFADCLLFTSHLTGFRGWRARRRCRIRYLVLRHSLWAQRAAGIGIKGGKFAANEAARKLERTIGRAEQSMRRDSPHDIAHGDKNSHEKSN